MAISRKEFLTMLEKILQIEADSLTEETHLKNLEKWDSLALVALIAMVEENFGVRLTPDTIYDLKTMGNLISMLGDKIS